MGIAVLVGTQKGLAVLRPDSHRQNWAFDQLCLSGWKCGAATQDAAGRTYVGVSNDVYGAAIVVSEDLENWRQLDTAPRYAATDKEDTSHNRIIGSEDPLGMYEGGGRFVDQVWKLHANGDAIYAGVSEAGLFVSRNRGESWDGVAGLNDHPGRSSWEAGFGGLCAHSILTDSNQPNRMWVGISAAGVYRTENAGNTWQQCDQGINAGAGYCVHALVHDPKNPDVIYRQDHRGMYRTDDGGDQWVVIEDGLPRSQLSDDHVCAFGFPVTMDIRTDSVFAIPLESDGFRYPRDGNLRVYRTRDKGANWMQLGNGLPNDSYASVLRGAMDTDDLDPCGVYFGTSAGKVYASADCGDSWNELAPTFPRIICIVVVST